MIGTVRLDGRWSLCAQPKAVWSWCLGDAGHLHPFELLEQRVRGRFALALLGYDLGRTVERMGNIARNDHGLPDLWVAELDEVDSINATDVGYRCGPLTQEMTYTDYAPRIEQALDYIRAGDIYQVNIAHRLAAPAVGDPLGLYLQLCAASPAPYSAYIDAGSFQVLSNSPELFLKFDAQTRQIETQPIKGTRRRGTLLGEDQRLRDECANDPKERAEHVMIVDLERNDLGRFCVPGSVRVHELHHVVTLPTVHHAVTSVVGVVRPAVGLAEILRATFPGGSITGAPKVRAMQIIEELEPVRRGLYTGAIGLFEPDGSFTLSLAIRTAVICQGRLRLHVGGGIVADSKPKAEWQETWHKAAAFCQALAVARAA